MGFTTNIFLFSFLPILLLLYYLFRNSKKGKIIIILAFSTIFYLWGGIGAEVLLICTSFLTWCMSRIIFNIDVNKKCLRRDTSHKEVSLTAF